RRLPSKWPARWPATTVRDCWSCMSCRRPGCMPRSWPERHPKDARYRDRKKAVESARKACELTDWKVPDCMDSLAAAYAETGEFTKAIEWQEKALAIVTK